jgi:hypothetical protein
VWVDLSPDRRYGAIVHEDVRPADLARSLVRIVGPGGLRWESDELGYSPVVAWSADGSQLAIGGGPSWILVRIAPGSVVTSTTVAVAPEADPSTSPSPSTDPNEPALPYHAPSYPLPVAFSADGRTLYGATTHDSPPTYRRALRVALDTPEPTVTPIDRFPTGEADRLAPTGYTGDQVDPTTDVVLSAERVSSGGILASYPGHVALMFDADGEAMFAMLRTADGATGSVRLRTDDLDDLVSIDLVDPRPSP